jgi:hypothetical protein
MQNQSIDIRFGASRPGGSGTTQKTGSRTRFADLSGLGGIGVGVAVYGVATALLIFRAPSILGDRWSWLALVLVPVLTALIAGLRTGSALALVLVYAFASATAMAVQGYRLGWSEIAQLQFVLSHFATVFFLASGVALTGLLRARHEQLERARQLAERYVSEDEVTGLLTHSAFQAAASRELSRSHRAARPLILLSVDLTEYFAPAKGSAAMASAERMLGEILCSQTRENQDLWTMWSEGVYLGLLAETDDQAVEPALRRVLGRIVSASEFAGQSVANTARFAVAAFPEDASSIEALIELALAPPVSLDELRDSLRSPSWSPPVVSIRTHAAAN